jgi:hypothetical protein
MWIFILESGKGVFLTAQLLSPDYTISNPRLTNIKRRPNKKRDVSSRDLTILYKAERYLKMSNPLQNYAFLVKTEFWIFNFD